MLDGGALVNWIGSLPDPVVPIASIPEAISALTQGQPTQIAEARATAANPGVIGTVGLRPHVWRYLQRVGAV